MNIKSIITTVLISGSCHLAMAQNCESSYFAQKGGKIETTEFDKSESVKSVTISTVASAQPGNGSFQSTLKSIKRDPKGTVLEDKTLHINCNGRETVLGLGIDDTQTKKEAVLDYPANMSVGTELKNEVTYEITKTEDGKTVKVSFKIIDRKVAGSEKITVKAGTWNCTKITYKMQFSFKMGFLNIPFNGEVTEWFNPEVGVVRTETTIKGEKDGHSEITSVSK
jgi:hypothetical protein